MEILAFLVLLIGSSLFYLAFYFFLERFEEITSEMFKSKVEISHVLDHFAFWFFVLGFFGMGWPLYRIARHATCKRRERLRY